MAIRNLKVYLLALAILSIIRYLTLFRNEENLSTTSTILITPITNNNLTTTTCTNIPSNILQMKDFTFYKNSQVCLNRSPTIIIFVHSAINYWLRRDTIRSTWGSVKKYRGWTIELVFMLGIHSSNSNSNTHGNSSFKTTTTTPPPPPPPPQPPDQDDDDIVIGNFIDTYANLTYKHLMGYKWVLQHCPTAKYIIKADDDIFLDTFHWIKIIEEVYEHNNNNTTTNTTSSSQVSIIGHISRRNPPPVFVSGLGFVIRSQAACGLLKIQNSKPFFAYDDVFITGTLRQELNLTIHDIREYFIIGFPGIKKEPFLSWYNKLDESSNGSIPSPSPWPIILLGPKFPELKIVSRSELWFRTMRAYGLSPGHGFND